MAASLLDLPPRPRLRAKAERVLDLYDRRWEGNRLRPDEDVISADEKSQLQALRRRHGDLPPGPERTRRVEFEYSRGGTLAYLAALDVHHAMVIGRCVATTGIVPFGDLVEQVMTQEPYASARSVFWVVDNGSSRAGQASVDRMRQAWPPPCSFTWGRRGLHTPDIPPPVGRPRRSSPCLDDDPAGVSL